MNNGSVTIVSLFPMVTNSRMPPRASCLEGGQPVLSYALHFSTQSPQSCFLSEPCLPLTAHPKKVKTVFIH
jgi:hypothetical protein